MKVVSAILPTRGRRELAAQALDCFLSQTYRDKQLVILDDANDPSFDVALWGDGIIYTRHKSRSIAEKRNLCCELAHGEVIAHLDSDDFSAPERISDQVNALESSGKSVTGYRCVPMYDEITGLWYAHDISEKRAYGTSLAYLKPWWKEHPFPVNERAEDAQFCDVATDAKQSYFYTDSRELMAARIHKGNTAEKSTASYKRTDEPQSLLMRQWASRAALAH